jgi:hypothetical protein
MIAKSRSTVGTPITAFDGVGTDGGPGAQLGRLRTLAQAFRAEFSSSGQPDYVGTFDLVSLPYPTRFGLWRAATTPAPFVTITNRMLIVRWTESDGRIRTLLFEPSDFELGVRTPYFAALDKRTPRLVRRLVVNEHGTVADHLKTAGIRPEQVDYLVFDHLHTQDVRRWLGTTRAQADLSPAGPITPYFPNAKLIVQRQELAAIADLHPLQRPWYQPDTYADVRPEGLLPIDGSVLLGPGVALLSTPGHVVGNQTLVLNTSTGIWASSENAIATECLTPEHSRIPGLARWAATWGQELVLNANTIEATAQQYNSLVVEKTIVDRAQSDSRFLQFFPSSELTRSVLNPGTAPTFVHQKIQHGQLSRR